MLKTLLLKNLQSVWFFHERKAALQLLQLSQLCFFQVADPKFKSDFRFLQFIFTSISVFSSQRVVLFKLWCSVFHFQPNSGCFGRILVSLKIDTVACMHVHSVKLKLLRHKRPGRGVQRESERRWDVSHGGQQQHLPKTGMGGEHF